MSEILATRTFNKNYKGVPVKIVFDFYQDIQDPYDVLKDLPDKDLIEIINKIKNKELVLFTVKCTGSIYDIDLSEDWLSGCIYKSYKEFLEMKDGYAQDMINLCTEAAYDEMKRITDKFIAVNKEV